MNFNVPFVEKLRWRLKSMEHKFQQYRLSTNETAEADTEYGKVKGAKRFSLYDDAYYSFEGIPYAQPPVGDLRYRAPQRPTPWEGVKDCTRPKDKPMQVNWITNKVEGSEDCLYLNVYTNNLSPDTARPVMVWIYGGGFVFGEANRDWYGSDYFMKKDVVVITLQYRLGSLGFMSFKTPSLNVPGNAGLKDQVLALKWIKNNCASFGGNPDNITLFGESAGGASVHHMMLTEQTRGLFHRAILMSGTACAVWATKQNTLKGEALAKLAGYKGESNDKDVLQFLINSKAKDLIGLDAKLLSPEDMQKGSIIPFGPIVETFATSDTVVSKHPLEMMKTAWSNSIPMMIGCTSEEGLLFLPQSKQASTQQTLISCLPFVPPELADPERTSEDTIKFGLEIKKTFVTGETPTGENYMDLTSYLFFWFPLHRVLLSRFAHAAGSPMYLYRFNFDSEQIIYPYRLMRHGRGVKGVGHADELTYLWSNTYAHRLPKGSREYKTIERMVEMWTQFANTGNPNGSNIDDLEALTWEPVKKSDSVHKCLNIGDELKFIELPEMEKIKAFENLYANHKDLLY